MIMKTLILASITIVALWILMLAERQHHSPVATTQLPPPTTSNTIATVYTSMVWNKSNGFGSYSTGPTGNVHVLVTDQFTGSLINTIRVSRIFPDPSQKVIQDGSNVLVWSGTNWQTWDGLNFLVWIFPDKINPYPWPVSLHRIQQ